MAPFDQDPKKLGNPPDSGVSGIFGPADPPFRQAGDDAAPPPGEFTGLFGKPPTPSPLEGIGTTDPKPFVAPVAPPSAALPAEPASSSTGTPGSFTAIFGANPLAAKTEPPATQPFCEPTAEFAAVPPIAPANIVEVAPPVTAPPAAGSFTSMFANPPSGVPAESGALPPRPVSAEPAPPVQSAPAEPTRNPSEFTMMFGSPTRPPVVEAAPEPPREPAPSPAPPASPSIPPAATFAKQEPAGSFGAFTQIFGVPSTPTVQPPPQPPVAAQVPPTSQPASPEEFANIFNFPLRDSSAAPEPTPKSAPGEFTKMFSSAPAIPFTPAPAPAAKDPGAFTKLFNAPVHNAPQAPPAQAASSFDKLFAPTPVKPREESFTGVFGGGANAADNAAKPLSYPPASQGYPGSNQEPAPSAEAKQPTPAWPPLTPSTTPVGGPPSGATQIFTRLGDAPAQAAPPPPTGPSAFTQVISGGLVREMAQQVAAQSAAPATPPPPAPQYVAPAGYPPMPPMAPPMPPAPPVMPPTAAPFPNYAQPPAMNAPGMWPVPQPPQMQPMQYQHPPMQYPQMPPPQMPAMQYPQMPQPKMPQPPAASGAPKKTNWIPLIIGVNVFVVIVLILILFFALRK